MVPDRKPRSYWGVILALGLGLSCWSGHAQETSKPTLESQPETKPRQSQSNTGGEDQSSQEEISAPDITPALKGIETAIRELIAEKNEDQSQREEERDRRDLQAQEDMAFWAKAMTLATVATVILTAAALWAIVRTLHHTRRAADAADGMLTEARATTKAAQDTILVTREIGQAQTRAYVSVESVKVFVELFRI